MHAQPTFYDVLDVSPDASREEIRAAYREKVKETHPDVSDDPDAERRFKRVTRAKEVLTDPDERARYDRLGHRQYVDDTGWTDGSDGDGTDDAGPSRDGGDSATATDDAGGSATAGDTGGSTTTGDARDSTTAGDAGGSATAGTGATNGTGGSTETGRSTAAGGSGDTGDATAQADGTDWRGTGDQRGGASPGAATAGGYATRTDYKEQSFDRVRVPLTPQSLIQVGTMFAFYPVFLFASLFPGFPAPVNVVVGLCTLFVIGYLLSIPEVGMVVFGGWGVLSPVVLLALPEVGIVSLVGVVALTACWVPFGLSVLTRAALRT